MFLTLNKHTQKIISFYDHRTASKRRRVFEKRTKSGPTRNEES
jgi:hypothetical protein